MAEKLYTEKEVAEEIKKALYKAVLKHFKDSNEKTKELANKIVDDINDPNDIPQVDSDKIPDEKETNVLYKRKLPPGKEHGAVTPRDKRVVKPTAGNLRHLDPDYANKSRSRRLRQFLWTRKRKQK